MIAWNNDLNLGVISLDLEHQNLLKLINKLSDSIAKSMTKEYVNTIFDELIQATITHSHNEENILAKCNYKSLKLHTEDHLLSVNQIRELKANYNNSHLTDNITTELYDFLLAHIITQDIPLIPVFKEHGFIQEEKSEKYIFYKLINKVINTISFTKRILLSALLPMIGMLILGFIFIMENYNQHLETKDIFSITKIISNVNSLSHALQVERGLSSGYLSSTGNKFQDSLHRQHQIVNNKVGLFSKKLDSINIQKMKSIEDNIKKFHADILRLKEIRHKVDARSLHQSTNVTIYTNIIENILNITSGVASFDLDPNIRSSISTLYSIQRYKEALGQSRAYGTIIIEQQNISTEENIKFIQLQSTKNIFLKLFDQTTSLEQKKYKNTLLDSSLNTNLKSYENHIINYDFHSLDSELWFESITLYINEVNKFENKLLKEIDILLSSKLKKYEHELILWIVYITSIIIITIFIIYLFEYSSKRQLDTLAKAMNNLADGKRDIRLNHTQLKDALSQMYHAYEITRQKLLHGDIYTQLYKNKKNEELTQQQKENDILQELASIDPLTSCVNRRKFEELSNLELQRSSRHNAELSFLMLDIDHFKAVNDTYGHAVGDEILKHFSSICLDLARDTDVVARVGGEEFIVMLPQTNESGAFIFAERFREDIDNSTITIGKHTIKYSVSIGISSLNVDTDNDTSIILQRADTALYEAKKTGRNKSVIFQR